MRDQCDLLRMGAQHGRDILRRMAWTEEQKEAARKELQKRGNSVMSTDKLGALLMSSVYAVFGFLLTALGYGMFQDHSTGWWIRGNGIVLGCIALAGAIVASLRTYVRFLDWRRALAIESKNSMPSPPQ